MKIIVLILSIQAISAFQHVSFSHTRQFSLGRKASSATTETSETTTSPLETITKPTAKSKNYNTDDSAFPPPLSNFDRFKRAAKFWSSALPIVASYYGLISSIKLREVSGNPLTDDDIEALWNAQHKDGAQKLANTVTELKGFYVKTAQIISARQDLFPAQYTEALQDFTDNVDPMPASTAKAVIEKELLHAHERFEDVFQEFDEEPLGAASVAQVHRAVLTAAYGGKEVAVKIQRPSIESKLLGDVANLKALTKAFRDTPTLPLDYYTVFCELETQLAQEFDFVSEAVSMERIFNALRYSPDGQPRDVPLVLPRPVPGLVSRRVLVMDYLHGVPLSRAREAMQDRGISPDSPQAKLFGRRLLSALTTCFGRSILETGFFHADPHPGNVFVLDDGRIGLIDFGQVKQINGRSRETLCRIMVALADRESDNNPVDLRKIGDLAIELGVEFKAQAAEEAPAAVGMWLFDATVENLPGGYDNGELSPNSPVKELRMFPQDLVLVGRSTILIKGLSNRLGIPWSLAEEWAPIARQVLENNYGGAESIAASTSGGRVRFRDVWMTFRSWAKGRATNAVRHLPSPLQDRVVAFVAKRQERKARHLLMHRQ